MLFVGDQYAVEEFAAGFSDESFAGRVRAWRLGWACEDADVRVGEDGVEAGGGFGVAVSGGERVGCALVGEVHEGVAGGLGGPWSGGVGGDAGQVGAAGAVFDQDQGVEALEGDGVDVDEVDGEDGVGLVGEELLPGGT